jgi:hypothetical protein
MKICKKKLLRLPYISGVKNRRKKEEIKFG